MIRPVASDGSIETGGAFVPIARPRVVERLQAAARHPIVLIAAPAGYGKSVALSQYLATLNGPYVRFDCGLEHATLLGFLHGLCDAIARHAPHAGASLAGAYGRSRASATPSADLALWMDSHLRGFPGVVAIDDLHVAEADRSVAEFVVALIERSKDAIAWMLASRSTAGLPIGTWLAYGDTDLAIDERDLRFTLDEAKTTARGFRLAIRNEELGELLELTDGWPTALSFALRTSTRSADLRSVAATTREMIYRYFAEQVYAGFDDEERDLLAVATALPSIDIDVLEAAGFDRALAIVENLRERTAFIFAESPRTFRCHDLFRDFIRREIERKSHRSFESVHDRAARALESTGDLERALGAYVIAGSRDDVRRVLETHGFDLLERACGDLVTRAVDSLAESARRENARILAVRGMLQATAGKNARAEALFTRAIARAGDDRELVAIASLRLAILLANLGRDTEPLLEALAADETHSHNHRAEALSVLTAQRASVGDLERAAAAIPKIDALLVDVDSDQTRAKVLQRMGVVLYKVGNVERATDTLLEAAELGNELHLYSLASRANASLAMIAIFEEDDIAKQLWYSQQASSSATKAGDVFDLQTSLLQVLGAETRRADVARIQEMETELSRLGTVDSARATYLVTSRAIRSGWEGRFEEAHRSLFSCLERLHHATDRVYLGAHCAFYLALLCRREEQSSATKAVMRDTDGVEKTGVYRVRTVALARMLCAMAEAISGRITHAQKIVRGIGRRIDPIATVCGETAEAFITARRTSTDGSLELTHGAGRFGMFGYGDIARLFNAAATFLQERPTESHAEALTQSECAILRRIADGATPKEIAAIDGRSIYTVQAHIANAIAKLGCHGRNEAIAVARRRGLLG
ncbi:MAG TPA: LuxR C-terminal-related transcriptional regulator [Candidatus Acidoferrales bacterium]|nr:LuxR C-terminal-related transcriptional regulator [Candidatus Acidoferrales bacterium]